MNHRYTKWMFVAMPVMAALSLTSCATKFNEAQRASLSTVAVAPASLAKNAYKEPDGGDRAAAQSASMVGATSGTGAIGGMVGALVGESIAAVQDGMYDSENSKYYSTIQQTTPNPAGIFDKRLNQRLAKDAFFGSRLKQESSNQFKTEVNHYGLVRASKTADGEIQVMPQVSATTTLVDGKGKKLFKHTSIGTGHHHPISYYSQNRRHLEASYEAAVEAAVEAFMVQLEKKTEP